MGLATDVSDAVSSINSRTSRRCRIAMILGSGLGYLGDTINDTIHVPYDDIAGFPISTAPGHNGKLLLGEFCGEQVAVLQGRFHLYEGWRPADIALPIRTLRALGADILIVTNAAGALNQDYEPGDIMLIEDHLNFTGTNPLIGPNDESIGLRFPDMSRAYHPALLSIAKATLDESHLKYRTGIYAGLTGPSLETSAERRFLRMAGADAVGMSTVLEVIAAVHAGMKVLGFSAITNMATGGSDQMPDSIEDVHKNARSAGKNLHHAISALLSRLKMLDMPEN